MGDFNELENHTDKKEGMPVSSSQCIKSLTFLNTINATTLRVLGRHYTWKSRVRGRLIYEKLDRAIGRAYWHSNYPNAHLTHDPFTYSDHCFMLLSTQVGSTRHKQPPFRFHPRWAHFEQVHSIIQKQWQHPVIGSPIFRITQRLKLIKRNLKTWITTSCNNYWVQIEKNMVKLGYVENRLIDNPDSLQLNHWFHRLIKQHKRILLFNKKYWG